MTITRLGACAPVAGGFVSPTVPAPFPVPAGGIPVGATIIMVGFTAYALNPSDSKGNLWTPRPGSSGMGIADCQVTTALVSGNTIVSGVPSGNTYMLLCFWQSTCYFEAMAQGASQTSWTGVAAVGPTLSTLFAGDLVLGFFGVQATSSPVPALTAVGAGYTDEVSAGGSSSPDQIYAGLDWVSKLGVAPGPETPSGTFNNAGYLRNAMTAIYTETAPNKVVGVL